MHLNKEDIEKLENIVDNAINDISNRKSIDIVVDDVFFTSGHLYMIIDKFIKNDLSHKTEYNITIKELNNEK